MYKEPEIKKALTAVKMLLARQEEGEQVCARARWLVCVHKTAWRHACARRQARRHARALIYIHGNSEILLQTVLDFSLSDSVYARARLAEVQAVNLWLGAGVMLEYPLEEARELLVRACLCACVCAVRARACVFGGLCGGGVCYERWRCNGLGCFAVAGAGCHAGAPAAGGV